MNADLIGGMGIACAALGAIAYAWMPCRAHRHEPARGHWDEDAQRWTSAPAPAVLGVLSPADLNEIDALEHLLSMPAYGEPAADHTTTSEGD